jgi:hypothetical protein
MGAGTPVLDGQTIATPRSIYYVDEEGVIRSEVLEV